MDAVTVARSMRGSIGMLAMPWLMADTTNQKAAEAGMPAGVGAYAIGRMGVLGDCPPDNVVAAAYFWNPDTMRQAVADGGLAKGAGTEGSDSRAVLPRLQPGGAPSPFLARAWFLSTCRQDRV